MLSIPVKSISSGEMFTLTAASSTTIGELKAMMEAEHGGGPAAMQTFVLGGELLDNDLTIEDAGVEEETVVTWMTTYSPPPPLVLQVVLHHITGKQYAVEVNECTTGHEIKTMMSTKEDMLPEHSNIPPSRQLIICAGNQMQDEDTVGEIDLLEQSMVRWVVRPAPPPPDEPSDPVDLCFKIGLNPEVHTVRLDQEWTIARAIDELVTECEALPEADGVRLIYGGEICDTEGNVYDYQFEEETCCQVMYIGEVPTPPVPPSPAPTPPVEEPPVEEPSLETISITFFALTGARIECDAIADIPFGEGQDEVVSILDQLATALECPRDEIILMYGGDRIDLSATPDDYCLGCASVVNVMRMRVDPGASVADINPITAHCQHCVRAGVKICLRPLCRECEQEQIAGFVAPEGFSGPRSAVTNGTTWNDLETYVLSDFSLSSLSLFFTSPPAPPRAQTPYFYSKYSHSCFAAFSPLFVIKVSRVSVALRSARLSSRWRLAMARRRAIWEDGSLAFRGVLGATPRTQFAPHAHAARRGSAASGSLYLTDLLEHRWAPPSLQSRVLLLRVGSSRPSRSTPFSGLMSFKNEIDILWMNVCVMSSLQTST